MKSPIRLLYFCVFLIGCNSAPYADQYTTVEPLTRDIVGYYEYDFQNLDSEAHDSVRRDKKPFIIINPDKTYTLHHIPTFKKISEEFRFDKDATLSGKWKIIAFQTLDGGEKHWGLEMESAPGDLKKVGFIGTNSPRGMIVFYGNLSEEKFMLLRKK